MKKPPSVYVAMTLGCLIGAVVILAQTSVRPDQLARAYAEEGVIGLLLKIGAVLAAAAASAIFVLYRRIVATQEEASKLAGKTQDLLLEVIRENTRALAEFRATLK